jgi:hypothetical protein
MTKRQANKIAHAIISRMIETALNGSDRISHYGVHDDPNEWVADHLRKLGDKHAIKAGYMSPDQIVRGEN